MEEDTCKAGTHGKACGAMNPKAVTAVFHFGVLYYSVLSWGQDEEHVLLCAQATEPRAGE